MVQTTRTLEERLKSNTYNADEFRMIVEKLSGVEDQLEPKWRLVLNNLTIKDADVLVNGAPN